MVTDYHNIGPLQNFPLSRHINFLTADLLINSSSPSSWTSIPKASLMSCVHFLVHVHLLLSRGTTHRTQPINVLSKALYFFDIASLAQVCPHRGPRGFRKSKFYDFRLPAVRNLSVGCADLFFTNVYPWCSFHKAMTNYST